MPNRDSTHATALEAMLVGTRSPYATVDRLNGCRNAHDPNTSPRIHISYKTYVEHAK
jgi:hypothetical protein